MNQRNTNIDTATAYALDAIEKLRTVEDANEFNRLDKIAQRACYLVHGLTRSASAAVPFTIEQDDAKEPCA